MPKEFNPEKNQRPIFNQYAVCNNFIILINLIKKKLK